MVPNKCFYPLVPMEYAGDVFNKGISILRRIDLPSAMGPL